MSNFDPSSVNNLIGLWDFKSGSETADTGLDDGIAQNGNTLDGNGVAPSYSNDQLIVGAGTNSHPTVFDVDADPNSSADDEQFNLDRGTLEVQFTQSAHSGSSVDVVLSRGEKEIDDDDEGFFEIRVTEDGKVQSYHNTDDGSAVATLSTSAGFFSPGDLVNVKYSFDVDTGAVLTVENLTTGASETLTSDETGLTFDLTDNDDEEFTFGARETDDAEYDKEFQGAIDYVALYESAKAGPDGAVDGEDFGEVMELGYDDSNAPTDQGGDIITNDADLIFGNGGDDTIDGEGGNDTIFGDSGPGSATVRESFNWDLVSGSQADSSVVQDTGEVEVTYTRIADTGHHESDIDNSTDLNVAGIDSGGETIDDNSALTSETGGEGNTGAFQWEFSEAVSNVEFNINDLDGDGVVTVTAFDASGNPVDVTLVGGSDISVTGNVADAVGPYQNPNDPDTTVQVSIPGPVSRIVVEHTQDGSNNSGIWITDMYFDVSTSGTATPGNDIIDGGNGDDLIYGEDGRDTIIGGQGADTMFGNAGSDEFRIENREDAFGDEIDGGTEDGDGDPTTDNENDELDLRGLGRFEIVESDGVTPLDLTTPNDPDGNSFTGQVNFLDSNGNVEGTLTFTEIEDIIPCFTPGTVIATPQGERLVEDLREGDRIITRDNGLQEIRWVGRRDLSGQELLNAPHLKPVLIRAGSLGHGLPERDMMVSPQHRLLINNEKSALYFEDREVLAAAKHLTGMEGVARVEASSISYIHFMFDQHEVVLSNGAWTESFQPGETVLNDMGQEQRKEIFELFPELEEKEGLEAYQAARRSLKKHEARLLVK